MINSADASQNTQRRYVIVAVWIIVMFVIAITGLDAEQISSWSLVGIATIVTVVLGYLFVRHLDDD